MNPLRKQSGFTSAIIILIVAIVVVAGGVGYYFYKTSQEQKEAKKTKSEQIVDETADWNIYQNEEYGFKMKYPEDWRIEEAIIADSEELKPLSVFTLCPKDKVYYHTVGGYTRGTMDPIGTEIWSTEDYQKRGIPGAKKVLISDNLSAFYSENALGEIFYVIQYPNKNIVVIFRSEIDMILRDPSEDAEAEELKKVFNQILSTFKFIEE